MSNGNSRNNKTFNASFAQFLAIVGMGSMLVSYGMTLGFIVIIIPRLSEANGEFKADGDQISWIASIGYLFTILGTVIIGPISKIIGRKKTLQMVGVPIVCAWSIYKFSWHYSHILANVCLTGLSGGLLELPVIEYAYEIAQPHLMNVYVNMMRLSIVFGILLELLLGAVFNWRVVTFINFAIPITSYCAIFFIPESPKHLLVVEKRHDCAKKSLMWLRGFVSYKKIEGEYKYLCVKYNISPRESDETKADTLPISRIQALRAFAKRPSVISLRNAVRSSRVTNANTVWRVPNLQTTADNAIGKPEPSLYLIQDNIPSEPIASRTTANNSNYLDRFNWKRYKQPDFAYAIILLFLLQAVNYFTGSLAIQTYMVGILAVFQVPIDLYFATLLYGAVQFLTTTLALFLLPCIGHKFLIILSLIGNFFVMVLLGIYSQLYDVRVVDLHQFNDTEHLRQYQWGDITNYQYVAVVLFLCHSFFINIGITTVPDALLRSYFVDDIRMTGAVLTKCFSYLLAFILNKTFLEVINKCTMPITFWISSGICAFAIITFLRLLPNYTKKNKNEIKTDSKYDGVM